ncbi:carbohydrate kinase family protein [Streptomyces sp. NPDC088261]|uniref:carbohydrate kinase family protein n=1 Tax=Streptomyces sp. NPDC088261 TaxID=3365851 RepID=UPI0037F1F7C5
MRGRAPGPGGGSGAGGGLLVVGDVATDVVARHRSPLARGTDTTAGIRLLPGGAGANAACWAARWGCADVRLLARVGTDARAWHEASLRDAGVRARLVVDDEVPTATVISLVDASAERTFLTDGGASVRLSAEDWSPSLLDGVGRLHLSGYLYFSEAGRGAAAAALASARERGVAVSVDPASVAFIEELGVARFLAEIEGAETLLPNEDEARLLTGLADAGKAAAALSRPARVAVVTLGEAGAVVAEAGEVTARVPPVATRPVDSTGAGDAFTGAYLAARLRGAEPPEAAEEGCRAGATAVTLAGGRPTGPGREEC